MKIIKNFINVRLSPAQMRILIFSGVSGYSLKTLICSVSKGNPEKFLGAINLNYMVIKMASYNIRDAKTGDVFSCHEDDYIIDAAEAAGLSYNYSSRAGADESTIAYVVSGRCENEGFQGYIDAQAALDGWILIDAARPRSNCVIEFEANAKWEAYVTARERSTGIGYPM